MILRFSKDLKEERIYANGVELSSVMGMDTDKFGHRIYSCPEDKELYVASIKNPVLVTDVCRIAKFNPTLRDTVFKLYESPIRKTEYDGVSINFEQGKYKGAWGPSIDTLLFCRALSGFKKTALRGKEIVEIGAGSGFISKYLLEKFPGIKSITLVDLSPHAIQSCKDNIKDRRAKFIHGDALKNKKKYDVLICNPPYIPRPKSIGDNAYEGTGLLGYLIVHTKDILKSGGSFITNISSLCQKEINEVIEKSGAKVRKIDKMIVPLKVCNVLNNKKWMEYLRRQGIKKERRNGYEYFQTITIVEIKPKL